jgi:hypothetical protein
VIYLEKIWVKVEGIQIIGPFSRLYPFGPKEEGDENTISASIRIGKNAFKINYINIGIRGRDGKMFQNWSGADARLLDVPLHHIGKPGPKSKLLYEVLFRASHLFYTEDGKKKLLEFVMKNREEPTFPFFRPEEWKGLSLRIPVEFVTLRNFALLGIKEIFADIRIGHHLIFWKVKIYDGNKIKLSDERILDPKLRSIIENLLKKKEVEETILSISETGEDEITLEFTDAIENCNTKKSPPAIRFY